MVLHSRIRIAALALAATASLGLLGACGGDNDAPSEAVAAGAESGAGFNDADVAFAQGMIPHHNQALDMARLAAGRASSPAVKKLAAQIVQGQRPEIEQLQGFLAGWERPLPEGMDTMAGMEEMADMPGMESMAGMENMENMATGAQIGKLKAARGKNFDRLFLQMMLKHHRSAVEMAQTERAQGVDPEAKTLAGQIVKTQNGEIARMTKLLEG